MRDAATRDVGPVGMKFACMVCAENVGCDSRIPADIGFILEHEDQVESGEERRRHLDLLRYSFVRIEPPVFWIRSTEKGTSRL
uniref:Uncharacterized protein n=1 Tax=Candidatus Methanogaster sp. ANME-2c ERB4 TaxID=2759911 RepID=A0A7G9Y7G4_9EURY|nr:hypothetical protein FICJDHNH_00037 [Methanosarcinales archaeon ANME-2c ERB4]QNO43948.1 hypothetical protein AECFJODE_00001 [Methanosarcinales archaeon ANME-2c ERB4]